MPVMPGRGDLPVAGLLLNPSGLLGRWVTAAYSSWDERRRVERVWDELVSAPSVLSSEMRADHRMIVEFVDYDCAVCRAMDWVGFGASLGIAAPESFDSCMRAEATRDRLARDRELADYLRIPGTPTFVSSTELHPGAAGLRLAEGPFQRVPGGGGHRRPRRFPGRNPEGVRATRRPSLESGNLCCGA